MLEAARASVRFYCPECGAGLRAPRADAGSVLDCEQCGEHVRIPRHPHPLESDAEDASLIPAAASVTARRGLRLLLWSLAILLAESGLLLAVGVYWVVREGAGAVVAGDPGEWRLVLAAALALDLALLAARSLLRWLGYRLCEPAAGAVRAQGWVAAARVAVVLRGVGYTVACLSLLLGPPAGKPPTLQAAAADTAMLVWLTGVALEFVVLFAWHRLLVETGGRVAGRPVARFALAMGISVIGLSCGVLLLRAYLVTALVRSGVPPTLPDGRPNLAGLPGDVWPTLCSFLVIVVMLGLVMSWHYARIVLALRASLPGPGVR